MRPTSTRSSSVSHRYPAQLRELDDLAASVERVLDGRVNRWACVEAMRVTASRCFALAPGADDSVLVPFLDGFNHPSASALARLPDGGGGAFARAPLRSAVCRWRFDEARRVVDVFAPERAAPAGSEVLNFYDLAGADEAFSPSSSFLGLQEARLLAPVTLADGAIREWAQGEAQFVAKYGFSPWL